MQLTQRGLLARDFAEYADQICRVEAAIGVRQLPGIPHHRLEVAESCLRRPTREILEHLLESHGLEVRMERYPTSQFLD